MTRIRRRSRAREETPQAGTEWIDLRTAARVDATSEAPGHEIAHAFVHGAPGGWRAASTGPQVITIRFRQPCEVKRVRLVFESSDERTQEFALSWASRRGETHGDVVRQQFNFSPTGATREIEDYRVELHAVERLEIHIVPDVSGRPVLASLRECRIA
jgi:hypothetical protein